ncbi:MAG: hypothetical protein ABI779_03935 [Acidobacteriota bacterium]
MIETGPQWLRKVVGLVIVLGLLVTIWVHRAFQEDSTTTARTAISTSTPPARPEDVRLDAWIDDSRIQEGAVITFWIAIQNTTPHPIKNVSVLAFRSPDFSVEPAEKSRCWVPASTVGGPDGPDVPVCTVSGKPSRMPLALEPGGVATVEGHLQALQEPGQNSIAAVVGWTDLSGMQRRVPVSMGPVTIEHGTRKRMATVSKAAQNFLKDLGLPLVFLWLAYWVKQLEEARQEKKKREEDEQEARRKRAEESTARIGLTWTQMLPKVHENAEKYYMPLMGYARNTAEYYAQGNEGESVIFNYLRFLARVKEMSDAIGGFYLKTRAGENIVSAIWDLLRDRADDRFTRPIRQELQEAMKKVRTLDVFGKDRGQISAQSQQFLKDFTAAFRVDVTLLTLFSLILTYETNQSYEFWYGQSETFPTAEVEVALAQLRELTAESGRKYKDLLQSLSEYVETARLVQTNPAGA